MIQRTLILLIIFSSLGAGIAADAPPLPKQVPPLLGTAVVTDPGHEGEESEWGITLTIPKVRWEVVGEVVPKEQWPNLKAEVESVTLALRLGGPSPLRESRIVDLEGRDLSRDQVTKRLAKKTPVLVSVSGTNPDPYYLQLTDANALIVILGPRDGYPTPELLPAEKIAPGDKK
jgi:hypothetical protein